MDKYGKLPVWAAVECMSLGTLSMLYGNLDPDTGTSDSSRGVQAEVAEAFGTKPYYLRSWMHHLTTVRNIAAHHDRFYNRVMTIRPARGHPRTPLPECGPLVPSRSVPPKLAGS